MNVALHFCEPKKYDNGTWTDCNSITRNIFDMNPIHLWYTIKFIESHEKQKFMIERLKNMKLAFRESEYTEKDVEDVKFGLQSGLFCMYPNESVEVNISLCYWCLEVQYEK